MTAHEIRPKQLRALLLLLVLVPLIPAALMIRFMLETIRVEQLTAMDRLQQLHSETLRTVLRSTPSTPQSESERAAGIVEAVEKLGDRSITARVVNSTGQIVAGTHDPWGQPIAQSSTPLLPGATVQVHLAGLSVLDDAVAEQRRIITRIGMVTVLSVLLFAGAAAWTLHRQIAIRDLKSTSVATVAHELRTPLASMRMLVDTLREGRYRSDEQLHDYLDLIASENARLTRLAETFLTFSRLNRSNGHLERTTVSVDAIIERAIVPLRSRLESPECEFSKSIAPGIPPLKADLDALAQVITNLLENALKYSEPPTRIQLTARAQNGIASIQIADQGIGIPEAEHKAIFDPFYQVDRKLSRQREGCGLGLAIAKEIVMAHSGSIEVASQPGKGSVFTIHLPIT